MQFVLCWNQGRPVFRKISKMKTDFAPEKSKMRTDLASVLCDKQTALFKHLVKNVGTSDDEIFSKLRSGLLLTGQVGPIGGWLKETKPAIMSEEERNKTIR